MSTFRNAFRGGWIVCVLGVYLALPSALLAASNRAAYPLVGGERTPHVFRNPPGAITAEERVEAARRDIAAALERRGDASIQMELSGFYVAGRLVAPTTPAAGASRPQLKRALPAAIQDVFNENQVPIMSPPDAADPTPPKIETSRRGPAAP